MIASATSIDAGTDAARVSGDTIVRLHEISKRFGKVAALDRVGLTIARGEIVGLAGRNGCGKSTLLHHIAGLLLPSNGVATTFGVPTARLGAAELARIGFMTQHPKLLDWMRVRQLLNYVSEFYARWDRTLAVSLVERLSLDVDARVQTLSPGNRQKLALVLALCHHPDLLLLDEPLSDLDPLARKDVLDILLERYNADGPALLVSSHLLHDIEPIIGRIVCLDRGKVTTDADLDSLKESYEAWQVTARDGVLPAEWKDPWVVRAEGDRFAAQLVVRREAGRADSVSRALNANVSVRALNLEQLFPVLIQEPVDAR